MSEEPAEMSKIEAAIHRARKMHKKSTDAWSSGSPTTKVSSVVERDGESPERQSLSVYSLPRVSMNPVVAQENRILGSSSGPHSGQNEYRMLRTRLMQRMRANNWQTLGVSAAGEGEGKTLTAINLAISIAAEVGQEAVLLELDLRRPAIHRLLGISPESFTSVARFLQGDVPDIHQLLFCPGIERLACALSSSPLERPSDLLASSRGQQLFAELRSRLLPSTIIVVDLPPMLSTDDALVVAPMIDAFLFVVAEGQTKRADLAEAYPLLGELNVLGTVLNKSVETEMRKYY